MCTVFWKYVRYIGCMRGLASAVSSWWPATTVVDFSGQDSSRYSDSVAVIKKLLAQLLASSMFWMAAK